MGRYKTWLKRKENATLYANEAVCKKCKYAEWGKTKAFCSGKGKVRTLTLKEWENSKTSFCPEYEPKDIT